MSDGRRYHDNVTEANGLPAQLGTAGLRSPLDRVWQPGGSGLARASEMKFPVPLPVTVALTPEITTSLRFEHQVHLDKS